MRLLAPSQSSRSWLLLTALVLVLCQGLTVSHFHAEAATDHECVVCTHKTSTDTPLGHKPPVLAQTVAFDHYYPLCLAQSQNCLPHYWGRAPPLES